MSLRRYALAALASAIFAGSAVAKDYELLNVSYDPTRELYQDYNAEFTNFWKASHPGDNVKIQQSHGGSGKQARGVIDGLRADVVTLALAGDIDEIAKLNKGSLPENWQTRLPDASTPYTSTIVFLVRKGNPKGIKDWADLTKDGVSVITPNPKTSGGARWNFLAAYAYGLKANGGDEEKAKQYLKTLFKHVPVLDTGARGSTITFVNNGQGDVLLAWENEAFLALKEDGGADKFDIVVPSLSILAEPPVAVVDKNADKKGNAEIAKAYLEHLYSPAGQEIAAKNFYRPRDEKVAAKYAAQFPKLELVTIDKDFGGWKTAQPKFFNDGGVFDQIYQAQ
ncbi:MULTISPECIES: sulfate ABC transporter substrate-binding protein [Pseudomonas]|uniref:sulfate ABC transporter substrate-binding protein n=1 Tax=Pseudomonas TaxID=286 RepID=UPI0002886E86|nr:MULTISPECIES: sulfate ABC transporter substrate-binding protein [Pseudomonas]AMB77592.1 ABC transporter permease [Pseudomonas fragi]MCB1654092.1 sulfate ABC transporter substrate-binding protein [Pseudomonadales bacterium]AUB73305.1 ABC transporter permease [Pseudomonas sp. Lz4W]MCH4869658.1 sulfate ABC transporter substrate-binding protein [Pseudomonas sp. TMW22089]NBG90453.1 sulfate ABC transporter substrate-binding protein [Pseudomonas sp. 9.1(2019)]